MEEQSLEDIKRNAYHKALQMKNTGMDPEAIYARLEKQGVPADIAMQVANNVIDKWQEKKDKEPPLLLGEGPVIGKLIGLLFKDFRKKKKG